MAYWLCQPCLLGDNAYDSKAVRGELRRRRIQAVISRKGSPNIKGLGNLRLGTTYRLHAFFLSLACRLICWRRLKKTGS
jgi:hypothetical protein